MDVNDPRFKKVGIDSKFRRLPQKKRKVTVDTRFSEMFKGSKFKQDYSIDQRGRPVVQKSKDKLERFYDIESDDDDDDTVGVRKSKKKKKRKKEPTEKSVKPPTDSLPNTTDSRILEIARGEILMSSSSDEDELMADDDDHLIDDDEDADSGNSSDFELNWTELDADAPRTDDVTCRLAICNMDWDRIKAIDLFVLLHSFRPSEGALKSVTIYLSDFGKQQIEEENKKGPRFDQHVGGKAIPKGKKFEKERLRQYQLNRLKYYFAIVECDSASTAARIYDEVDGLEYESSAAKFDLRYVPDEMEFGNEVKSQCDHLPIDSYQPPYFFSTALSQSKVELTWDETDKARQNTFKQAFSADNEDLSKYIAPASDQDDDDDPYEGIQMAFPVASDDATAAEESVNDDGAIAKYRKLLGELQTKDEEGKMEEMEVSWEPTGDGGGRVEEGNREPESGGNLAFSDDELPDDDNETGREVKVLKKRRKNQKRPSAHHIDDQSSAKEQEALSLLLANDDDDDEEKHFNLKKLIVSDSTKKGKKKQKKAKSDSTQDSFEVDTRDPRFSALYRSSLFNIDPSAPEFKKTEGMQKFIDAKVASYSGEGFVDRAANDGGRKVKDEGWNSLVDSLKRKSRDQLKRKKSKLKKK